jgi:hypothetical protein
MNPPKLEVYHWFYHIEDSGQSQLQWLNISAASAYVKDREQLTVHASAHVAAAQEVFQLAIN